MSLLRCSRVLSVPALILASACVGAGDAANAPVVTDSAGVRIVHNMVSQFERRGEGWALTAEPTVVIGSVGGADPAYLFDRIMGIQRLSDGRWAVADMGSSQVRFYDADGGHLFSVGRSGDGPGEFRQVMGLTALGNDRLGVDDARSRFHIIDGDGDFIEVLQTRANIAAPGTEPVGSFADGTLVGRATPSFPQQLTEPHWQSVSYVRLGVAQDGLQTAAVQDTIGTWNVLQLVPGWRGQAQPVEFQSPQRLSLWSDGIVTADPGSNEVRIHSRDGSLRTIARREWTPVPVTPEVIEERRSQYINMTGEGGGAVPARLRDQRQEITETWQFAPHMPAFSAMHVDAADNVWLRDYVANEESIGSWYASPVSSTQWTVFSADGELLGGIELPARLAPLVFGEDYVAGIYRDELEVEHVHVYGIEKI